MIIDAHAHLGWDEIFDEGFTEQELLESQEVNGIDVTLVQPGTCVLLRTVQEQHDAIADLANRCPGRFLGIANPNPHLPGADYEGEVRRCIEQLGFVGVKLHPLGHAVNPLGNHGRRVFALAQEMGIPVMVHTGPEIRWAAPTVLSPVARAYPGLRIVAAHAGGRALASWASLLAEWHSNIYLEPSWVGGHVVRDWVRSLGPQRIMFGSDHADNAVTELTKLRSLGLSGEEIDWVLGRTAAMVFGLNV